MHRYCFNVYFKRQSTCLKSQCHKNFLAIFLQMCLKQNVALHHILTDFQLRGNNNDSAKQTLQKSSSHIFSEIDYCFMTFCSYECHRKNQSYCLSNFAIKGIQRIQV